MSTTTRAVSDLTTVIDKQTKAIRAIAKSMPPDAARILVDSYYDSQEDRKRSANQTRAADETEKPHQVVMWLVKQHRAIESRIKIMLDAFSEAQPLGAWARKNRGIGPILASGLLAHIDITKCKSGSSVWAFAGLDPNVFWEGKDKTSKELQRIIGEHIPRSYTATVADVALACDHFRRRRDTINKHATTKAGNITWTSLVTALARKPWNGALKTLAWKIGESFVKVSGHDDSFYGSLYAQYKAAEVACNTRGEFAKQAEDKLRRFNIGTATEAYKSYSTGKLPAAHLHARAKRRVVKLFLSHYFEVGYELLHRKPAPRPWAIDQGGHVDYIPPPNW